MNQNIKVIYNKLENIKFNKQGYIDLNNSKIQSQDDILNLCNLFKDPRYETFRVFYMRGDRIVGQEAITSRMPDGVMILGESYGEKVRGYEKMANRMRRLNADGYYLAHNHPSGSARASKCDIIMTQKFNKNVNGFLGHIVIGGYNRYSIIEKNKDGKIERPEEKILDDKYLNVIEEKLEDNSFYNMKINCRTELVALFMKMQNEKEYSTAILTDAENQIRMVLEIPNKMLNQDVENLNGFFKNIGRNIGANKVFLGTHNQKAYFKIIEHQRYGTFKDILFISRNNKVITPKIKNSPNLFDEEQKKKCRKNMRMR